MFYPHELRERQRNAVPYNKVWPLMSVTGTDLDNMKKYLNERDLSFFTAENNGWYPSRNAGDAWLRIVIPAVSVEREHVYWQARAMLPAVHIRYQSPAGARAGALVLVRHDVNNPSAAVVVVEGPMDALAVASSGLDAVALMGITPGTEAINHLLKLVNKRPALVILDSEPEASKASHNICMHLAGAGGKSRSVLLSQYKDLAACPAKKRLTFLRHEMELLHA